MQYIPIITLLLWSFVVVSYSYLRDTILQPEIKFPLVILLTIFLTVSFWILQKQSRRIFSLLFVALFLFNTGIVVYGLVSNNRILKSIPTTSANQIEAGMARLLITADSEIKRKTAARIIYERHGIALPYKVEGKNLTLYVPTKKNRDAFITNQDNYHQQDQFKKNLSHQTIPLLFLLLLQLIIFVGLLIYLILSDNPRKIQVRE